MSGFAISLLTEIKDGNTLASHIVLNGCFWTVKLDEKSVRFGNALNKLKLKCPYLEIYWWYQNNFTIFCYYMYMVLKSKCTCRWKRHSYNTLWLENLINLHPNSRLQNNKIWKELHAITRRIENFWSWHSDYRYEADVFFTRLCHSRHGQKKEMVPGRWLRKFTSPQVLIFRSWSAFFPFLRRRSKKKGEKRWFKVLYATLTCNPHGLRTLYSKKKKDQQIG